MNNQHPLKFIYSEKATKFFRNLPLTFDCSTYSQKLVEDFAKFCGLFRIYELYQDFVGKAVLFLQHCNRKFNFSNVCNRKLGCPKIATISTNHGAIDCRAILLVIITQLIEEQFQVRYLLNSDFLYKSCFSEVMNVKVQSNLVKRNGLIRNKLVLSNHFP